MTAEPWRYRCPKGHTNIRIDCNVFQCRSCETSYARSELVDLHPEGVA